MADIPDEPTPKSVKPDEFITHLRLINFTLLVASVGLIITATQPAETFYSEAIGDLKQMIAVNDKDLAERFRTYAKEVSAKVPRPGFSENSTCYVPAYYSGRPVLARFTAHLSYLIPRQLRDKLPDLAQPTEKPPARSYPFLAEGQHRINTLDEFQRMWDFFSAKSQPTLMLPSRLSSDALIKTDRNLTDSAPLFTDRPSQAPLTLWDSSGPPVLRTGDWPAQTEARAVASHPKQEIFFIASAPTNSGVVTNHQPEVLVQMWDAQLLRSIKIIKVPGATSVTDLAVSPDGSMLAGAVHNSFRDHYILVWKLPGLIEPRKLPMVNLSTNQYDLAFSPDSRGLLVINDIFEEGAHTRKLNLISASDLKPIQSFKPDLADYRCPTFAPDGITIGVSVTRGLRKRDLCVLDAQIGRLRETIGSHNREVNRLLFLPGSKTIASASHDGTVEIWDVDKHTEPRMVVSKVAPLLSLALSPDGKTLAAGGYDMRVHLVKIDSGKVESRRHVAMIRGLCFTGAGNLVCVGMPAQEVELNYVRMEDVADGRAAILHMAEREESDRHVMSVRAEVDMQSVPFDVREDFIRSVRENRGGPWIARPFETAFPALNDLTKHLRSSRLDQLSQHLEEEAKRTGDKFEALGLKIPVSSVAKYGFVLLLGLEVYFLIHLRAFRTRRVPGNALAFQPWIGLYQDPMARAAFLFSAVVLPVASSSVLTVTVWHGASRMGAVLLVCALLASIVLSAVISREIWFAWRATNGTASGRGVPGGPGLIVSDDEVAVAAYDLWEKAGRPLGRDKEFWQKASEQLRR